MGENSTGAGAGAGGIGSEAKSDFGDHSPRRSTLPRTDKQQKLKNFLDEFAASARYLGGQFKPLVKMFELYWQAPDDPPPASRSCKHEVALKEWLQKLDWAFKKKDGWGFPHLGMHMADTITRYVRELESDLARHVKVGKEMIESRDHTIKVLRDDIAAAKIATDARDRSMARSHGEIGELQSEIATLTEKLAAEMKCAEALRAEVSRLEKMQAESAGKWEAVDSSHPITEADVGCQVQLKNEEFKTFDSYDESSIYSVCCGDNAWMANGSYEGNRPHSADIVAIYRRKREDATSPPEKPQEPRFVFDGSEGVYETDELFVPAVVVINGQPAAIFSDFRWKPINLDGSYSGGRLTKRIGDLKR